MVCTAHRYDAIFGLHHCDKNGPGFGKAQFSGAVIVNGVSIVPGCPEVHVAASALGGTIGKLIDGDLIRFDLR